MVDDTDFYKEAHKFTKNTLHLLQDSFGCNGLDCMILRGTGSLVVTNNGYDIIKSLSVSCPVGKFLYQSLLGFYKKTGDFSKKYFLLLATMLDEISTQTHQTKLQIGYAFQHILLHVIPDIFEDFKMIPYKIKSTKETVICILRMYFSGKFNEMTTSKLISLIKDLLFDHPSISVGQLANRVVMVVEKFKDIFWELPGSSVMSSTLLKGILLPRDFSTRTRLLQTTTKPFKFIVLGTSLGCEQPQTATTLDLKETTKVNNFLEWHETFIGKVFQTFSTLGIKLILCSKSLSETFIHFCNQFETAAVQYLPNEDMWRVCDLFKINPIFDIDDDLTPFIGEATLCKAIGTGQSTYVYLEGDVGTLGKQVLLYAPTQAMCTQYSKAIENALKVLKNSFIPNENGQQSLSVLPSGAAFEFKLISLLETYKQKHNLSTYVELALDILRQALSSIPRELLGNKSTFCAAMAQARTMLKCSDTTFVSLNKKGQLCGDIESIVVEPLSSNFDLLTSVIQILLQILRTDKIICVSKIPVTTTSDSD